MGNCNFKSYYSHRQTRCRNAPSPAISSCERANPASFARPLVVGNTYEWRRAKTSNCITADMPGIYSVTVTDPNGCFSVPAKKLSSTCCRNAPSPATCPQRGRIQRALHASGCRQTHEWRHGRNPTASQLTCRAFIRSRSPTRTVVSAFAAKRSSSTCCRQCTITGDFSHLRGRIQRALHALVAGNTYEWSTGRDVQLHYSGHAGHLFGHRH